jgi:putative transposase
MLQQFVRWCTKLVKEGIHRLEQTLRRVTKPSPLQVVAGTAADVVRTKAELIAENALLRQQLVVLQRSTKRVQLKDTDRRLLVVLARFVARWREALFIVKPDTLLEWHRQLFKLVWRRKSAARVHKSPLPEETISLIKRMAHDNRLWGAERIRGELLKLCIRVSKRTIQKYMRQARPPRSSGQTWLTFLHNHAEEIWVCDFVPVVDIFFRQHFAFFIAHLASRRVVHVGVTDSPTDAWVAQQLREATPFGEAPKYLIRDNDSKFGTHFNAVAIGTGIKQLKIPVGAPDANAVMERFIGSVRRECLDHILVLSTNHLRRVLHAYVTYFNTLRPHQGLQQNIPAQPDTPSAPPVSLTTIRAKPILGGLHHAYEKVA